MLRKNYLVFVLMIAAILIGSTAVFAQDATISGRVQTTDDKGKKIPAPNVLIEAYRTDTKTVEPTSAKTDAEGKFTVEGLPSGKEFALAVSGENLEPTVATDIKSGASNLEITLKSGNGSQPSAELVRQTLLASGKLKLSAEEIAEEEKAMKKREENIAKTQQSNAESKRLIEEGSKAFENKDFDLAISKFDEGYQADPDFLGTAPGFLNNKGIALGIRAVDYFNAGVKNKEVRTENYAKASEDFNNGIDAFYQSWTILKNASEKEKAAISTYKANRDLALSGSKTLIGYTLQTDKVNPEKLDKVKELLEEYINSESDKAKKAEAQTMIADYYRASGDFDTAIAEYRKILGTTPNEPGALFGLGISLVSTGYNDDGSVKKAQLQEAANLLKKFTDVAPPTAKKSLQDAKQTLVALDQGNGITPKK